MQEEILPHTVHKKIDSVLFSVASPKLVKKLAAVKVVTPELYDKEGYPVDGGLMDTRLGVIDPGLRCKTCGGRLKECNGHFGYIELARPVIHIKFVNVILTLLRCTCRECGRILIPKEKIERYASKLKKIEEEAGLEERHEAIKSFITEVRKVSKCPYCKAKQERVVLEKPSTFMEGDKRLSPIEIRTRLEKIPDDDLAVFGLKPEACRPEWTVLTILPIPPVTMRPSITLETGERSEDDLTHKLGDIVRINQRLFENINAGAPEIIIEDLWDLLQYHVTTYFDNNIAQLPPARHRSGQPLKTLTERIKSKEGRIRHNLAGKRTNFSSRTVISPDPMLRLNEVGVPLVVAMKLSVPERVTEWNIQYLKQFVERGAEIYPGANYIIRPDGKRKKITEETKAALLEEIQPGYIVERHLLDGDIAVFNRQPSLHRMSMMCHRVRVLPYKTFRLNPAVDHPYNADFDGDEMNLHIPQTEEARAEAEILMQIETQLISPRYGFPVMGCIQDAITGNYLLTRTEEIPREDAIALLFSAGIDDFSKLPNKAVVSGRDVFSVVLPDGFEFKGRSKAPDAEGSNEVVIKDGILVKGVMDKANLGHEVGLMLGALHKKYGAAVTADILGKIFRLGIKTLLKFGFTTALSDGDVPESAKKRIKEALAKAEEDVNGFINLYNQGKLETFPGRTTEETLELKIIEVLNRVRSEIGKIVTSSSARTSTTVLIECGARGSSLNVTQMSGCIGQQAMRGKRIWRGYRQRTLSHFRHGDLSPAAHGFVRSSFKEGLKPWEFFFSAITGRDSLMDTALRTPKSGYLYRRLANALQDMKVEYDGTVRDANGSIVQFAYGEDGIDVAKSEGGKINVQRIVEETK